MKSGAKARRVRVIARLEAQLKAGTKPFYDKEDKVIGMNIPLTEKDRERIEGQIQTLKTRI